jgi:peptidoglycan/LPS O-acetylase OafA/YrhL
VADADLRVTKSHIPALDGVRGLAALAVLVGHLPGRFVGEWGQGANLAVDVFFVLSGFLITRLLLADKAGGRGLRRFYWRRALRIFPIYFLVVGLCWVFVPSLATLAATVYLSNFHSAFDHTIHPLSHAWSLSVEEHFYLAWPFVVYLCSRERSRTVALWCLVAPMVALLLASYALMRWDVWGVAYYVTPIRMAGLAAGALMAFDESRLREKPGHTLLVGVALLLLGLSAGQLHWLREPALTFCSRTSMAAGLILMPLAAHWSGSWSAKALGSSLPSTLGRISYGLYLYHFPIYFMFGALDVQAEFKWALIAFATTFLAALVSYRLIEEPLLRLKDRQWGAPVVAAAPA